MSYSRKLNVSSTAMDVAERLVDNRVSFVFDALEGGYHTFTVDDAEKETLDACIIESDDNEEACLEEAILEQIHDPNRKVIAATFYSSLQFISPYNRMDAIKVMKTAYEMADEFLSYNPAEIKNANT